MVTTEFIIYMTIITVKQTRYGNISTLIESDCEYITENKQYYLISI